MSEEIGYELALARLRRRLRRNCRPTPLVGNLRVFFFRRRMRQTIRARYLRSEALF